MASRSSCCYVFIIFSLSNSLVHGPFNDGPFYLRGDNMPNNRPDHDGTHQMQFRANKRRIYATEEVCGICGRPVDKSLKFPHPLSKCIDHIIPIVRGGHPSSLDNLQLAHLSCNRAKSDKLMVNQGSVGTVPDVISNRNLPQSMDWSTYRARR